MEQVKVYKAINKNFIINGDMQISQRGDYETSATTVNTTSEYKVDRWKSFVDQGATSAANMQLFKEADRTSYGLTDNGGKIFQIDNITSQTGRAASAQPIEDISKLQGKTVTFSAMVRDIGGHGNARLAIWDGATNTVSSSAASDGNFHKVSVTGVIASNATMVLPFFGMMSSSANSVSMGVNDKIEVAQLKLEIGSVATEFVSNTYAEELHSCMRYYESHAVGHSPTSPTLGRYGTNLLFRTVFSVMKRTVPTMHVVFDIGDGVTQTTSSMYDIRKSGFTINNSYGGFFDLHEFSADAEIY